MLRKSISDSRSEKETISEAREKTVRLGRGIIYTFTISILLQNTFTSIRTYIHSHIHTFIWHKLHTYIHTYKQMKIHTCLPIYVCTFVDKHMQYIRTYCTYIHTVHKYIHTYIHRSVIQNDRQVEELNVELEKVADKLRNAGDDKRRLSFIHTYIHTYIHTHIQYLIFTVECSECS